jgi:hypothetical protein
MAGVHVIASQPTRTAGVRLQATSTVTFLPKTRLEDQRHGSPAGAPTPPFHIAGICRHSNVDFLTKPHSG